MNITEILMWLCIIGNSLSILLLCNSLNKKSEKHIEYCECGETMCSIRTYGNDYPVATCLTCSKVKS